MKKLTIIISATILVVTGVIFFAKNQPNQLVVDNSKDTGTVEQKPATLSKEIKSVNGQLIDVRESSEYEESHADSAINIPLDDILKADYSKIDSSKPIYLICRSGNRAEQAKVALEKAGYENVKNIGGLVDWENQGEKVCGTSKPLCS